MSGGLGGIGSFLGGVGSVVSGVSSLFGGGRSQDNSEAFAREQLQFQRDAATHGIRWRVADAEAAGIHKLYALGGNTFSPAPIAYQGGGDDRPNIGDALAKMGQGVERAIGATMSKKEREETAGEMIQRAQETENRDLQNQLLRAQIASIMARTQPGQMGPALPSPAESKSPATAATGQSEIKPNEITSSQGDVPHSSAGPVAPSNQWRMAPDGRVYPTPEKNLQMDDMGSPGWLPWMYRNHVLPYAKQLYGRDVSEYGPPRHMLPRGADGWEKNIDGSWTPVYRRLDRDVESTRHNRLKPKWADPKYRRY